MFGPVQGMKQGMQNARRSLIADELASAFMHLELHSTLLSQQLTASVHPLPPSPSLVADRALVQAFSSYTDQASVTAITRVLDELSDIFVQLTAGPPAASTAQEKLMHLKAEIQAIRVWLIDVADGDFGPIKLH
jgi:hypothetical protein